MQRLVALLCFVCASAQAQTSGDDDFGQLLLAAAPRCTLTASPGSPAVVSTITLTATCTRIPSSYVWSGPNIAAGTATTANTYSVLTPGVSGAYTYTVTGSIERLHGSPASALVNVAANQPPQISFTASSSGLSTIGTLSTFIVSANSGDANQTYSVQWFVGSDGPIASGSTLNWSPSREGVYNVRAVVTDAASASASISQLHAVTVAPNAAVLSAPGTATVGTIAGSLGVSDSGAAGYTIPIKVPPGAGGLQPSLALNYSSQSGNGHLGVGWSVGGLSMVFRCEKTYATDNGKVNVNYDATTGNDAYCLDGERLIEVSYRMLAPDPNFDCSGLSRIEREYRTERDTYARIRSVEYAGDGCWVSGPYRFEAYTKSGQVLLFGQRHWVLSFSSSVAVKTWPLDKIYDRAGNYMVVLYGGTAFTSNPSCAAPPSGYAPSGASAPTEFYPTWIFYTRNDSQDPPVSGRTTVHMAKSAIKFVYGARDTEDTQVFYDSGAGQSQLSQRLTAIETYTDADISVTGTTIVPDCTIESRYEFNAGTLVKKYEMEYMPSGTSMTGRSLLWKIIERAFDGTALPPTQFAYTPKPSGELFATPIGGLPSFHWSYQQADIDGDGRTDLALVAGVSATICLVRTSSTCAAWPLLDETGAPLTLPAAGFQLGDFNGDGKADVVAYVGTAPPYKAWVCYTNASASGFDRCYTKSRAAVELRANTWSSSDPHFAIDLNGDGRNDLIFYDGATGDVAYWHFYLASSDGGFLGRADLTFSIAGTSGTLAQRQVLAGDFDGDGRTDLLIRRVDSEKFAPTDQQRWKACFSRSSLTNGSFDCQSGWVDGPERRVAATVVADFNGDGLADIASPSEPSEVLGDKRRWRICLSEGDGSFACNLVYSVNADVDESTGRAGFSMGDFNGDGRTDMIRRVSGGSWQVCYATGSSPIVLSADGHGYVAVGFRCDAVTAGPNVDAVDAFYGDFAGTGRTAIASNDRIYSATAATDRVQRDLLIRVTNGLVAIIDLTYAPLTDSVVYSKDRLLSQPLTPVGAGPGELLVQSPLWVVQKQGATNGIANHTFNTTYRYSGLKARIDGRGVMGFAEREVTEGVDINGACPTGDPATNCVRTFTAYEQSYPQNGRPKSVRKFVAPSGGNPTQLVNDLTNTWTTRPSLRYPSSTPPVYEVVLSSKREKSWELSGVELPDATTTTTWDAYGNPLTVTVSTSDEFKKVTQNTYYDANSDYDANWLIGRLATSKLTSELPLRSGYPEPEKKERQSSFSYNPPTGPRPGLFASETIEPSKFSPADSKEKVLWQQTSYAYDGWGNKQQTTVQFFEPSNLSSPRSRTSTVVYEPTGRFPQTLTNALGHHETRTYDHKFGAIAQSIAPNAVVTNWTYDGFGRKVFEKVSGAGGAPTLAQTKWTWFAGTNPVAYSVAVESSDGGYTRRDFDLLEREIASAIRMADTTTPNGVLSTTTTAYDDLGRKSAVTRAVAGSGGTSATRQTIWLYDALSRIVRETDCQPGASSADCAQLLASAVFRSNTVEYSVEPIADSYETASPYPHARTKTIRDATALAQQEIKWANSQGQTVQVRDNASNDVKFAFDVFGNLQCVTPPTIPGNSAPATLRCAPGSRTGLQVAMAYDLRGRKIDLDDPDSGRWSYGYSGVGELASQKDGRGYQTSMSYDALGRTLRRDEAGVAGAPPLFTTLWTYDSLAGCGNATGKLCKQEAIDGASSAVTRKHFYDAYARPYRTETTVAAGTTQAYDAYTLYDTFGRIRIVGYPLSDATKNPVQLRHSYFAGGGAYTETIEEWEPRDGVASATATPHWSSPYRYADGQLYLQTLGTGAPGGSTTTKDYDQVGRIKAIKAGAGNALQNASFGFDHLGNLTSRSDAAAGLAGETFGYDALNRLTSVSGSVPPKTFKYDAVGNLVCRSDFAGSGTACSTANLAYTPNTHRLATVGSPWAWQWSNPDGNGNVGTITPSSGSAKQSLYKQFNLPSSITQGSTTLSYIYDGDHARVRETVTGTASSPVTTYIGNAFYEHAVEGGVAKYKHYLAGPDGIFGVLTRSGATATTVYWHKDHLGSVVAEVTRSSGATQRLGYDAWGKRRLAAGGDGAPGNLGQVSTQRGFTGHEMLDEIGLVHMNGRIYDPITGRFLQADPLIQDPWGLQSYNRYGYVLNNPLSLTDPSGLSWWTQWRRPILAIAAAAAVTVIAPQLMIAFADAYGPTAFVYATEAGTLIAPAGTAMASSMAGFAAGGIQGGNIESAVFGALTAGAFNIIGSVVPSAAGSMEKVLAHAAVGCGSNALAGGSCRAGAASAGFAEFAGPKLPGDGLVYGTAKASILGGIGSVFGGGKFANGAVTGAFGYLFNEASHRTEDAVAFLGYDQKQLGEVAYHLKWVYDINAGIGPDATSFWADPSAGPERSMYARLLAGRSSDFDIQFFRHEVAEASLVRARGGYTADLDTARIVQTNAHRDVLKMYDNSSVDLYHPSVVRANAGWLNGPAFQRRWPDIFGPK
jgi:RHS repeat-associated protein